MINKYEPTKLPGSKDETLALAAEREEWAKAARERDQPGTAKEFELMAMVLRDWAALRWD